jgi:uncharacterized protein (UPF0333 family)
MPRNHSAQIALPFILLISGIIIEIAIAGSFVAYFLSVAGLGERLVFRAEAAARVGLADALAKISANKEYAQTPVSYTLDVDGDSVAITVTRTVNDTAKIYVYSISAQGTAGTRQKKFVATAVVSQITGELQLQSVVETTVL